MRRQTWALRLLLSIVLAGIAIACALLYVASLESAVNWPTLAYLRIPVFLLVSLGALPLVLIIALAFTYLRLVDEGEVLSERAVRTLRRMRALLGVFAGYFLVGFVAFWVVTGLMQLVLLLAWVGLEVLALVGFVLIALFERVFTTATQLRRDNDLTV